MWKYKYRYLKVIEPNQGTKYTMKLAPTIPITISAVIIIPFFVTLFLISFSLFKLSIVNVLFIYFFS